MSEPDPTPTPKPKVEETDKAVPDGELDEKSLEQVAGGFNPCPEPPGRLNPINPPNLIGNFNVNR